MDSPSITGFYREYDPMKRKKYLEESIQQGEDPKRNAVRKELWEIRYQDPSDSDKNQRADGFLGLWMLMEYNKETVSGFFGGKRAKRELDKMIKKMQLKELQEKGGIYEEMLYQECCHMIRVYMQLCTTDRSYGTAFGGLMSMSDEKIKTKIRSDIYKTAIVLPGVLKIEEDLGILSRAAREVYQQQFPGEESLPE